MVLKFIDNPYDLKYLSIVNPDVVKDLVKKVNSLDSKHFQDKKLVIAMGTGGTISMKVENGIRVPDLNFDEIFANVNSHLDELFHIVGLDAFQIDSSQMDYAHVRDLAIIMSYIWDNVTVPFVGFLVLHGTDTMAYSAATISLMMGQGLPFSIVYTGAQKSIQEPMNDAGINFRNALFTLDALYDADMAEVVIVMGDKAILGTSAVKVNDTLINAFDAPLHKYITNFSSLEFPVRLASWLNPRREEEFLPVIWEGDYAHTLVINSSLGLSPDVVARQVKDPDIRAVLLYSYGAGTVDDSITDAILGSAKPRNLPVFVVSPVNTKYKIVYKSAKSMIDKGVVPLYMTLPAALAKIEIALRLYPDNINAISEFMTESYVGEIPDSNSRFHPILER